MLRDGRCCKTGNGTKRSMIRLMTWNIHGARTFFGKPDLRSVIAFDAMGLTLWGCRKLTLDDAASLPSTFWLRAWGPIGQKRE